MSCDPKIVEILSNYKKIMGKIICFEKLHRAGRAWSASPPRGSAGPSKPPSGQPPASSSPRWQQPANHCGDGHGEAGGRQSWWG